jgi:preprotein translocase subunit SecY
VNYAKRQVGNKIYGGQSSHLPLKLNMSGVIPPIFRVEHHSLSGNARSVVRFVREHDLVEGSGFHSGSWSADLRDFVRGSDRFLLFLLYGPRLQLEGDGG